jgi:hypothetical protein
MGPFRHNYCRILQRVNLDVAEMRRDPALLKRSGLEDLIDHPECKSVFDKVVESSSGDLAQELGMRLRKALGDEPVFDRNAYGNSPFAVPYYHSYVEGLNDAVWTATCTRGWGEDGRVRNGHDFHIVPYSDIYDSWNASLQGPYQKGRSGFMCSVLSPYEYCFVYWDKTLNGNPAMKYYAPQLFDDGTFGVWLGVLPQPVSLNIKGRTARLSWAAKEPRVQRSDEMGRYTLPASERVVEVKGYEWRHARALALVTAFEKMAANEPADHHKAKMLAEHEAAEAKWRVRSD